MNKTVNQSNPIPINMKTDDSLILEQNVEIQVLPISDERNGKMCEICLTQFSTGNDLYAHMILDHDGGTFQAKKHENNIDISEQWRKRIKLEPNIEITSVVTEYEKKPFQSSSKIPFFHCTLCESPFDTTEKLQSHITSVHERKEFFQCSDCDLCFMMPTSLKKHSFLVHKRDVKNPFKVTNEEFDSNESLIPTEIKSED